MKVLEKIKLDFNNIVENIKIIIITFILSFISFCILFIILLSKYNLLGSFIIKMLGK